MKFELKSDYSPKGDQPNAIQKLVNGLNQNETHQTLLGATGTGKTFTMANVISKSEKPTLILCHNKTLAAQLYGEFKSYFPNNAVEYFISYYDYYQPEAFIPQSGLYIEKDLSINDEIEKLRLSTTSSLMTGRRDIIVVASVSCIYGLGNPEVYAENVIRLKIGDKIPRKKLLFDLVDILYSRSDEEFARGTFRVKGDTVDIFVAYGDFAYRIIYWDDEIEYIKQIDPSSGKTIENETAITIFPANLFVTSKELLNEAITNIQDDLILQKKYFESDNRNLEAKRLLERTEFDLEMMRELGYCSGIENYSRYFDGRTAGERPFCLLDYFPEDYLMMIDESHVTIPQVRAMWGGDRSRKVNLVEYGFRLPSAIDNRPLSFNEFEKMLNQVIYVSATPADYELNKSEGIIIEQVIRPTGLLDPIIEVRPSEYQIDDLLGEIDNAIKNSERVLITTLTKRMAEELNDYLKRIDIKCKYIHSEVDTLDRVEILRELRLGVIDVLVGVNLLREGLDLPEVSLVAIFDADKEGFLRNERSLIQTIGRAARNKNGKVIMYADNITGSMEKAINETARRRQIQINYNTKNDITPTTIIRSKNEILKQTKVADRKELSKKDYHKKEKISLALDPVISSMDDVGLKKLIEKNQRLMEKAAKDFDFIQATKYRDEMFELKKILEEKFKKF